MDLGVVNTTLSSVAKLINSIKNITGLYTTQSLSDVTKLTRVEPLTIVSRDCLNLEEMPDVMQSLLSMFAGYYLQAVSMLTKVSDVEVVRILDRLNPDRDETGFLLTQQVSQESVRNLCLESHEFSLPTRQTVSVESNDSIDLGKGNQGIYEVANLSVGKLLNVEVAYSKEAGSGDKQDNRSIKIPVNVRLMASLVPASTVEHILCFKTEDNSLVERFHAWRAGRISFIKDLIFCQDLIDEYKRATIGDETDTMQEIIRRVNNAKKFGLLTKNPSLVSASNLVVISEEVAKQVESKLGGKLSNPKIRQKAFDNTYAMIIVVVDREYQRVVFYSRGISASTDLSFKEIKNISKNKGPDIMDILKGYNMGGPVAF